MSTKEKSVTEDKKHSSGKALGSLKPGDTFRMAESKNLTVDLRLT